MGRGLGGGARRPSREPRKKGTSDLIPRILVAIPAVAFAIVIIWQGEWIFAAGIGALCGIVVGTLVVWYWSRTYDGDWISGTDGLLLGIAVTLAAPVGDLFESLIKRDMGTKDTGTLFGAHGGALDRVDAALFALVAGYYVWLAVG